MKYAGHTMGTPKLDIFEAMELFKKLGYDGIEVRVAKDGQINSESISNEEAGKISGISRRIGINFACLTPYYMDFIAPSERENNIKQMKRVVEIADILSCPHVRVYGGKDPCVEGIRFNDNWERTASGIAEVAGYAAKFGVKVCIETHIGSLTLSVKHTVRMIEDVNMNNVGMLFDFAWVDFAGAETPVEAVHRGARYIFHCHIKDWNLISRYPVKKQSCLMGEGTIDWKTMLKELKKAGYNGYLTDEYEKFWYPDDLPEPEIGMKHNLSYVKRIWEE